MITHVGELSNLCYCNHEATQFELNAVKVYAELKELFVGKRLAFNDLVH